MLFHWLLNYHPILAPIQGGQAPSKSSRAKEGFAEQRAPVSPRYVPPASEARTHNHNFRSLFQTLTLVPAKKFTPPTTANSIAW